MMKAQLNQKSKSGLMPNSMSSSCNQLCKFSKDRGRQRVTDLCNEVLSQLLSTGGQPADS